uniref:MARVEL domain-containing protein n=1 Tax=Anthurium amnicola TaxID=1678845 RepID=A0A1D1Y3I9_9ARAE
MAEKKDTNPFSEDSSSIPHVPPSAYQPNPFPINPTEGNPWATSQNYSYQQQQQQQPSYQGHGYNTSSDNGTQSSFPAYLPMPSPSTYKTNNSSFDYSNNAYNTQTYNNNAYDTNTYTGSETNNAYEQSSNTSQVDNNENVKNEYDNNSTELDHSAIAANPGIETHDPDKLKISSQMLKDSAGTPNKWRLLSRFIQFIASAGAFAFIVASKPATKVDTPDNVNKTAIIFLYIVSAVSIIYSFGHLLLYCFRRWGHKNKAPRWLLMLCDAIIGASFGTLMVFLIKDSGCKPGALQGWCDYYNTSIFFTVLAFTTYAVSFVWDIAGGFKRVRSL